MTTPATSAPDRGRRLRPPVSVLPLRLLPARSVLGFLALLALLFVLAYAVGGAVGPVAPGLRPDDRPGTTEPAGDSGGMPGMAGMTALGARR
ncbi:hypothetical protein [Streptomyces noursei]|uniref:hypothetical protein n=1 Tax=Streptomyces noursei TaxID=1971 RepID=UPI00081C570D|nr:hypothetical protein [Streptomyces noursei]ANZ20307.1 membrane protein [Streptomyces noursei ATCC 11455]MCZ1013822.1 hypothetical protein [Streptomyces noursei]GGX33528.1 hypothetical protein GCM10010341_63730 [Streptomyces noursei]